MILGIIVGMSVFGGLLVIPLVLRSSVARRMREGFTVVWLAVSMITATFPIWMSQLSNRYAEGEGLGNPVQVFVETQSENKKAKRLYEKCGYLPCTRLETYHEWFKEGLNECESKWN